MRSPGQNGGKRPGAGRKSKAEEAGLAALLDKSWPQEMREQTIEVLSAQSRAGNVEASKLLLAYAYGKPTQPYQDLTDRTVEELAAAAGASVTGTGS